MDIQVLEYVETPGNQYQLGFVAVLYGTLIIRYRVTLAKEGGGYYILPPSVEGGMENGKKTYQAGFEIDSKSQDLLLKKKVREYVDARLGNAQASSVQSYAQASGASDLDMPF